jgi:hypothetical protein
VKLKKQKIIHIFFVSLAILVANYGHSRKKQHNFATTFFAKNKPLTTTYTFLD